MTDKERSEQARSMQATRTAKERSAKALAEDPYRDLRPLAIEKVIRTAFESLLTDDNLVEQWAGGATLLRIFGVGDVYSLSAAEIRVHLDALIPPEIRHRLSPAPTGAEMLLAERHKWYDAHRRHSSVVGLYIEQVPDWMLPTGMTSEQVIAAEAPDLSQAVVTELGQDSTHVNAVFPDGSSQWIERDPVQPPDEQRGNKQALRLASQALARRAALTAP